MHIAPGYFSFRHMNEPVSKLSQSVSNMQFAINIAIFVVTFAVVATPIQSRKAIENLVKRLRFVTNSLGLGIPGSEQGKASLLPDNLDETRQFPHTLLLTKFVKC